MKEELALQNRSEEDLIGDWIQLQYDHVQKKSVSDLMWAHEALDEICDQHPENCLRIIVRILERDRSEFIAGNLAAGPLEDLLSRHGPSVIDAVESEALIKPRFRDLFSGIWRNTIREDVWERIQAMRTPEQGPRQ